MSAKIGNIKKDLNETDRFDLNKNFNDQDEDLTRGNNNEEPDFYKEMPWTLIDAYFGENHLKQLVRHQLESYNDFVNYQIEKTIHMFHPITICSEQDYDKTTQKHKLEMFIS
jgi:DNA-directed RNA polymerase beta subunit